MQRLVSPSAIVGRGGELGDERRRPRRRGRRRARARWIIPQSAASAPADLAAEQQQLLRPGHADQPRQQPGRAAVGREAALDERLPELAVSAATVKSAASASWQPSPAAQPRTAHTTGSWIVDEDARSGGGPAAAVRRWMLPVRGLGVRRSALVATTVGARRRSRRPLEVSEHDPQRVVGRGGLERVDHLADRAPASSEFLRSGRSRTMRSTPSALDRGRRVASVIGHGAPRQRRSLMAERVARRRCRRTARAPRPA